MSKVLTQATHEWSSRPADQRYKDLASMHRAALGFKKRARVVEDIKRNALRAAEVDGDVVLLAGDDKPLHLTHFSFGQLASAAGAPGEYLRKLPAEIVVPALNHGLELIDDDRLSDILVDSGGKKETLRALTSDRYDRIWNVDLIEGFMALEAEGTWRPAPPAFDESRGLYLSDRDMFVFMVDNERRIFEKQKGGGLGRGFFSWNAEGGGRSYGIMAFLYEYICGNHRVWGAQNVYETRVVHIGDANGRSFAEQKRILEEYAGASAKDDEARIRAAQKLLLGKTKDEVIEFFYSKRLLANRRVAEAFDLAEQRADEQWYGDPRSAWGMSGALTEIARDLPNADARRELERTAGKVLDFAVVR